MKAVSFNNDWCYASGTGAGIFSMGQDAPTLTPVTLPHDASIHQKRTPDAVSGGAKGFYPDGVYHYVKKFEAPLEWKEKCVKLEFEGVVFTMFDSRTNLSNQVVENVKSNLDQPIFETMIPRNVRLAEAPSYGQPITVYDSKSSGAESYRKLAYELIEKNKAENE